MASHLEIGMHVRCCRRQERHPTLLLGDVGTVLKVMDQSIYVRKFLNHIECYLF